jgi:hypothetical protein
MKIMQRLHDIVCGTKTPEIADAITAVRIVSDRTKELNEKLEPYLASDDPMRDFMNDLRAHRRMQRKTRGAK